MMTNETRDDKEQRKDSAQNFILTVVPAKTITTLQVPILLWEPCLKISHELLIMSEEVSIAVERKFFGFECMRSNQSAYQVFANMLCGDKMLGYSWKNMFPKTWWFKFKTSIVKIERILSFERKLASTVVKQREQFHMEVEKDGMKLQRVKKIKISVDELEVLEITGNVLQFGAIYDVKFLVPSGIYEIIRFRVSEAFDSSDMVDIFQLIVSVFGGLIDMVDIFQLIVSVFGGLIDVMRPCGVMWDIECDDLMKEVFTTFLDVVRNDHLDIVFSLVQNMMIIFLEEREGVLADTEASVLGLGLLMYTKAANLHHGIDRISSSGTELQLVDSVDSLMGQQFILQYQSVPDQKQWRKKQGKNWWFKFKLDKMGQKLCPPWSFEFKILTVISILNLMLILLCFGYGSLPRPPENYHAKSSSIASMTKWMQQYLIPELEDKLVFKGGSSDKPFRVSIWSKKGLLGSNQLENKSNREEM